MCHRNSYSVVLAVAASIFTVGSCFGSEIRVWSGGAVTPVMNVLVPQFEQQTSHKVQSRIMTVSQLPQKLAAGERGEMVITALPDIDQFIKDGFLRASSRAILGSVGIALVVREGAPKPDISTPEKLRKVLLDARKIVHSRPGDTPSGKFLIEVFQDLGVTEEMKPKVVHHNVVDGVGKHGINLADGSGANIRVYDNLVMNTQYSGLRFNTVDLSGAKVWSNTFYNTSIAGIKNAYGAVSNDWGLPPGSVSFVDNIFYSASGKKILGGSVGFSGLEGA